MRMINVVLAAGLSLTCMRVNAQQSPPGPANGLFSSYSVLDATLEAPLNDLFAKAQAQPEYSVKGTLRYADPAGGQGGRGDPVTIDNIDVSVRGNTSKAETECPFPKLKLHFAPGGAAGSSIFSGMKAVKIGTHCGELPGEELSAKFGRLANEKAPFREALVYRLLDAVHVPSFKARPARITY